jgi:hypothetical protein
MAIKKHFVRCFRSFTTTDSHGKQNVKCRVFSSCGARHEQSHHQRTCFESVETLDFYSTEIRQDNHIKYVNTCSIRISFLTRIVFVEALQTTDDLPTASLIDFHPTAANFSALMMEKLPPVLMRLQGFISRSSNFPSERQLKIPLISPFDGCVTGKSLVCQVRMVPSMGTPMFDAMLDFLTGRPIDLPLLRSTINFLLNKSQPNQRSLFILSTTRKVTRSAIRHDEASIIRVW